MNSETSIYYIPDMDCPVEEKLIRDKLKNLSGIESLNFNLVQRKLTITYKSGLQPDITNALVSLDMGATLEKPLNQQLEATIPWKKY